MEPFLMPNIRGSGRESRSDTRLHIDFVAKPHPHAHDRASIGEAWGIVRISLITSTDSIILYATEWNIESYAEWFIENHSALCSEECIIRGEYLDSKESIAQGINRLQSRDFSADQEDPETVWFESLYAYRKRHSFRFALRGAAVPDIFIGLNHGVGEISVSDDQQDWVYQFNMDTFCLDVQQSLSIFIAQWGAQEPVAAIKSYAALLTKKLASLFK